MDGIQLLKEYREKTGLSVRKLCANADISKTTYGNYVDGTFELTDMKTETAYKLFNALGEGLGDFFNQISNYKNDISKRLDCFNVSHPREYNYNKLKIKYRNKVSADKKRNPYCYEDVLTIYHYTFSRLEEKVNGDILTPELYDRYIVPLEYRYKLLHVVNKNDAENIFFTSFLQKGFSLIEAAELLDLSKTHMKNCLTDYGITKKMKIITYLKMCYILELDPDGEAVKNVLL